MPAESLARIRRGRSARCAASGSTSGRPSSKIFVASGGGLFVVCGRNTNLQFVNQELLSRRRRLLSGPVAIRSPRTNLRSNDQSPPQVAATEHPILAPCGNCRSAPSRLLQIRQQLLATADSLQRPDLEVVATGPTGSPLLIDCGLGEGRVVTLLTGLTNDWSNWAQDPTFVVVALRTLGYLGSFRRAPTSEPIGSPVEMVVSGSPVLPEAEVLLPAKSLRRDNACDYCDRWRSTRKTVPRLELEVAIDLTNMDRDLIDGLLRPGIFETWMINSQGEKLLQNSAHNVAAAEGNLERVTPSELEQKLVGIPLDIRTADAVSGVES